MSATTEEPAKNQALATLKELDALVARETGQPTAVPAPAAKQLASDLALYAMGGSRRGSDAPGASKLLELAGRMGLDGAAAAAQRLAGLETAMLALDERRAYFEARLTREQGEADYQAAQLALKAVKGEQERLKKQLGYLKRVASGEEVAGDGLLSDEMWEAARNVPIREVIDVAANVDKICCLFHSEKTPSMVINDQSNRIHCFGGCGRGWNTIDYVMEKNGLSARQAVAQLLGITLPGRGAAKAPAPANPGPGPDDYPE